MNNKRKMKKKKDGGFVEWLKYQSACLASSRPEVQFPVLSKTKNMKVGMRLSEFQSEAICKSVNRNNKGIAQ
jgi:hypothetical protein